MMSSLEVTLISIMLTIITPIKHFSALNSNPVGQHGEPEKKRSATIHRSFLAEHAKMLASKMRTMEEKALKAIIQAEESHAMYHTICELLGKQNTTLTQVDIMTNPAD
jgi:hypothetical protein